MSALAATVRALLAAPAVTAVVSTRVYPVEADQGARLPAIVVDIVSERDSRHLSGADQFPVARVQIQCLGRTPAAADKLAGVVIATLQDLVGTFAGRQCEFSRADSYYSDASDNRSVYRVLTDFYVRHRAA